MERFNHYRDRGLNTEHLGILVRLGRDILTVGLRCRVRHCTFPPRSATARAAVLSAAGARALVPSPVPAVSFPLRELLSCAAMAADWVVGEEGRAVVYTWGTEYLVG